MASGHTSETQAKIIPSLPTPWLPASAGSSPHKRHPLRLLPIPTLLPPLLPRPLPGLLSNAPEQDLRPSPRMKMVYFGKVPSASAHPRSPTPSISIQEAVIYSFLVQLALRTAMVTTSTIRAAVKARWIGRRLTPCSMEMGRL